MSHGAWCGWCARVTVLIALLSAGRAHGGVDTAPLLKGVTTIASPGSPGALCVLREPAEAVIVGRLRDDALAPVVAATSLGRGRVVAFGHSGYLDKAQVGAGDTGTLIINCVRWTAHASGHADADLRIVTVDSNLHEWLKAQGFAQARAGAQGALARLDDVDVLVTTRSTLDEAARGALRAFVERGGGLMMAQTGWGWRQLNGDADIRTHAPSILLRDMGLAWTGAFVEPTGKDRFEAALRPGPLVNFDRAFRALFEPGAAKPAADPQAGASVTLGLSVLPAGDTTYRGTLDEMLAKRGGGVPISERTPLKSAQAADRALTAYQVDVLKTARPEDVRAHPAAAHFPGAVPAGAPRVTLDRAMDLRTRGWHSLGVYAPPGEVVTVSATFRSGKPVSGLSVQIGCHTDELWHHGAWKRVPDIVVRRPIDGRVSLASAFGGLVYIDVGERSDAGDLVDVRVEGAVAAPLFVLGQTTPEEWRATIRSAPGPWAELATGKVIVTVPSTHVRDLDDPTAVLKTWDRVLDAAADLAAISRDRARPQRYVADVQISAGYMHSGYPIMTHLDAAESMVQDAKLKSGSWGLFHELGHNHQDGMWTFSGTGEVTCNLFSLYICETVCALPVSRGHGAIDTPKERRERTQKHLDTGAKFDRWKDDPFLALEMYIQLREAFGWEPFTRVFAEYQTLGKDSRPRSDDEKRDQWMVRMSRAVGRNLGPFFQAWGVPTSEEARTSIADLPAWMPPDFPPK